jgi:carboxyl-terminal processing protease
MKCVTGCVAGALVSVSLCAPVLGQQARAPLSPEQQLLLNIQKEIVDHSLYKLQTSDVVRGALGSLNRDLGAEYDGFFREEVPEQFGQALALFMEVLRKVAGSAPGRAAGLSVAGLIERSMGAYCRTLDAYSDYLDAATAQRLESLSDPQYIGVGISFRRVSGAYECRPFEGAAADRAGVLEGDILLAVDGHSTAQMPLLEVAARVSGKPESTVVLTVRHATGVVEEKPILRERVRSSPVEVSEGNQGVVIVVRRIDESSYEELKNIVKSLRPKRPVTLDFRGCGGGELGVSVGIAELFLPAEAPIARLETLKGRELLFSRNRAPYVPSKLVLLQDGQTASGAELIIAALLHQPALHAESRGHATFGKGLLQRQIQVVRGGILEVTEARMYGPVGEFWDGKGLRPSSSKTPEEP